MNKTAVLRVQDLSYAYRQGAHRIQVLDKVSFEAMPYELAAFVGASGSGKSTLLHVLGLLDVPASGKVLLRDEQQWVEGQKLTDTQRAALRCHLMGMIYQFHHLLGEFTALENVLIPLMVAGKSRRQSLEHAEHLLETVGLKDRLQHRPTQLSGGQQQRVAIARALANSPRILLADEPTGNLDEKTAHEIFDLFSQLSRSQGLSVIMATHNLALCRAVDKIFSLSSGLIKEVELGEIMP